MIMRSSVILLLSLLVLACSGRTVALDEPLIDGGVSTATDTGLMDSGNTLPMGSRPNSCGTDNPVDCTEFGDGDATCIDSSHCSCSLDDNYKCEGASDENGAACSPGIVCVVKRRDIEAGRVGNAPSSCGDPEGQGLIPIDCTRYGDVMA